LHDLLYGWIFTGCNEQGERDMKTKIILILLVSLALTGCNGSKENEEQSGQWKKIDSFEKYHNATTSTVVTYVDNLGHEIVIVYGYESTSVTQIR
jgi:hypothetical protein